MSETIESYPVSGGLILLGSPQTTCCALLRQIANPHPPYLHPTHPTFPTMTLHGNPKMIPKHSEALPETSIHPWTHQKTAKKEFYKNDCFYRTVFGCPGESKSALKAPRRPVQDPQSTTKATPQNHKDSPSPHDPLRKNE